jgi:ubiquinone/menaquinone biosynthesis C-methylase UbiE
VSARASARLAWVVDALAVAPDERLLEVGCGHGVAVSLVCERLETGTIHAIDRSATMIEMATRRNRSHVDARRATFATATLAAADLGEAAFDTVFAVHVAVFWREPETSLGIVRRVLAPGGRLVLASQAPGWKDAADTEPFTDGLAATLGAHGFAVEEVQVGDLHPPAACVVARPV